MPLSDLAYRIYERRLAGELDGGPMPRHVGVIIDGNRRYAAERGLGDASDGHLAGAQRIDGFLDWCLELSIPYVTLWLLSTENLDRDDAEVERLLAIIEQTVERIAARGNGLKVTAVGALDLLPESTRRCLKLAEEATAHHDRMQVDRKSVV